MSAPLRRRAVATVLAGLLIVGLPLLPGVLASGSAAALVRIPIEPLVVALLLTLLPWRPARLTVAATFALVETTALVVAAIDAGYEAVLAIHFNPSDWQQLGDAFGVVQQAVGGGLAVALVVVLVAVVAAAAIALTWAALRVGAALRRRRSRSIRATVVVAAAWVVGALTGAQLVPGQPVASAASIDALATTGWQASTALAARAALPAEIRHDAWARRSASDLLTALRGRDVVFAFVESYGRVAVQGRSYSPGVDGVLRSGQAQLAADGYASRSAWLTSPTFGGLSWLAHSTLQSGLWIDRQSTYDDLIRSDRFTLSDAFAKAGWKTVSDVPSDVRAWPFGRSFYHYGTLLDSRNVGYRGPRFGYARIPDQYTWKYFADHELSGPHRPVMAEVDLVSSHTPWAPLPRIVPWSRIGDGAIYRGQPARSESSTAVWQDPRTIQKYYGLSVEYALRSTFSFLHEVDDPNLVVVMLGDHQPSSVVSGRGAGHQVPVSVISRDPSVLAAIAGWRWQHGLRPSANAPDWRMDRFRDRFLSAYR